MAGSPGGELTALTSRLVVARDREECVLGRPDLGIFVEVPEPGALFVEALQAGASLADATLVASRAAGEPVDGEDFLATLMQAGLLDPAGAEGSGDPATPARGRPIRWIEGVSPAAASRLFGPVAWSIYGSAALFAVGVLLLCPQLRPTFESAYFLGDPVLSILGYAPIALVLAATHEAWHWLAGRALGVPAVFRISYRGVFVVFETDLTQIVTVPRRRRYGAYFAGMAFDFVVLAVALLLRLLNQTSVIVLPIGLNRLLGTTVLGQVFVIVWQWAAVFLRSDVYAALANVLRCQNLYRTTWLTTKRRLWRLTGPEVEELTEAAPRDRAVARWFSVVYLGGLIVMMWMFLSLTLPALVSIAVWLGANLAGHAAATSAFWEGVGVTVYLIVFYAGPALLALRERRLRQRGELR